MSAAKKPEAPPFVVVVDTREQAPYAFEGENVHVIRAALPSGDYSFAGARGLFVVERKSVEDLASSVTWGRERFMREVQRMTMLAALGGATAVVVEGDVTGLERALAGHSVKPWPIVASTLAIVAEGVPVVWAGDRAGAEKATLWLLKRWAARVAERKAAA